MAFKNSRSQIEILESSRIALTNVTESALIQPLMEAFGYNTTKINQGKTLLTEARTQYDKNQTLEDDRAKAFKSFTDVKIRLQSTYALDRKKTKIVFKQETIILKELGIKGIIPKAYIKWIETITQFYNTLNTKPHVLQRLVPLQVTQEHITAALAALNELEILRAAYIQVKGTAQNETKIKNKAFKSLENYMSEFFAVARIALEEKPQLLESLGKQVKS